MTAFDHEAPGDGSPGRELLNPRQQAAVDFDGGPLVVLAGPGTGKTRVITHRIERMIRGGIAPETIVALTYTVKAAQQLRRRLAELVGGPAADRVNAHTFHGFGLRLLRRFPESLGASGQFRLVDKPVARRMLRRLARKHDVYSESVATGRDAAADEASEMIGLMANGAIFPEDALAHCRTWRSRLEGKGHGLDEAGLAGERARLARFEGHARLYGLYAAECARLGWATFDDLILLPIRLLRGNAAAAAIFRDDYRHYVVDEFQDVNAAQIEMLRLLCPPGTRAGDDEREDLLFSPARRGPDLCIVGDDDQAIYEFRGADDRAFARFEAIWGCRRDRRISLSDNYRSQRPVIDVANAIMARSRDRFEPEKRVEPAGGAVAAGAAVECVALEDDIQQGEAIAAMILSERAAGGATPRAYSDFAVIARGHADLERIGLALELEGIPVRWARGGAVADDRGVQDVLRWIELLVLPPGVTGATFAAQVLLTRPPISIPGKHVSEWVQTYQSERSRRELDGRAGGGFLEWLGTRREADAAGAARRVTELLEAMRPTAVQMPADAAVFQIIRISDVAHGELLPARERAVRIAALTELLRFVRSVLDVLDPPADLATFYTYYTELTEKERELRPELGDRVDGGEEAEDDEDVPDRVTLITAHSAKGLEFDTVFVPRVRPRGFPGVKRAGDLELPEGLIDRAGDERSADERHASQERRLFYVAATRAERRLVLLAKHKKSRGRSVDYFEELTLDPPANAVVIPRRVDEVFRAAAAAGVRVAGLGPIEDEARELRPVDAETRQEILDHAARGARLLAAQSLDLAESAGGGGGSGATPESLERAGAALRDAAERIAVIAAVRRSGEAPAWADAASPGMGDYARRLAAALRSGSADFERTFYQPLKAPLRLSFSWIQDYRKCPRCFYLRRVLKVPEPAERRQIVGQVVHGALYRYYEAVRAAEADGRAAPGREDLLRIGREEFLKQTPVRAEVDAGQLEQVLAQLAVLRDTLDVGGGEIEQLEESILFPYPHTLRREDGSCSRAVHSFEAKIDRLDRLPGPGAGHRIVDYKTGRATDRLKAPKKDDLQLGVYAMAVRWRQEGSESSDDERALLRPAAGVAEYWCLSTGDRGRIDLGDIAYAKVKAEIDDVVTKLLLGQFPRGREDDCWGLCTMLA